MITSLFQSPLAFVIAAVCILIAIAVHEFSHAFAADKLGDPTPRLQGRLTLNPMAHLDLLGTAFLLLVGFGWGKPVQFDPYNLRDPRKDAAIISFAGPLSNFAMALVGSLLLRFVLAYAPLPSGPMLLIGVFLQLFVMYNIVLGVFNLLPIHPLDGFKIVGGLLPSKRAKEWFELERYGFIFIIFLIIPLGSTSMLEGILRPLVGIILSILLPNAGMTI